VAALGLDPAAGLYRVRVGTVVVMPDTSVQSWTLWAALIAFAGGYLMGIGAGIALAVWWRR